MLENNAFIKTWLNETHGFVAIHYDDAKGWQACIVDEYGKVIVESKGKYNLDDILAVIIDKLDRLEKVE